MQTVASSFLGTAMPKVAAVRDEHRDAKGRTGRETTRVGLS